MPVGPQRKPQEPVQLDMLKPARELYNMHSMDTATYGSVEAMREAKTKENAESGLDVRGGIRKPVQIIHGDSDYWGGEMGEHTVAIGNGNHRVTAAMVVNPDMEVQVMHHDQFDDYLEHHTEV